MNDKFLRSYRVTPRSAFSQELRSRLDIHEGRSYQIKQIQLRPVLFGALTILLALGLTLTILPSARAQVEDWVDKVGNLVFSVTGSYPGGDGEVITVPEARVSLAEARAQLSFPIDLPTWVPEGYVMQEKISIPHFNDPLMTMVDIHWEAPKKASLGLTIIEQHPKGTESSFLISQESKIEEVLINGETAVLTRGGWQADTRKWDNPDIITLYLERGEQTYIFRAFERYISIDELIHIASSLP